MAELASEFKHYWTHGLYLALILCLEACEGSDFGGVNKTSFLLYTERVSWPIARNVCASEGGALLDMRDPYKRTIIQELYTKPAWSTPLSPDGFSVWIGLYDVEPPNQQFVWTNSCHVQDPGWTTNQSTNGDVRCVMAANSGAEWQIANCNDNLMFICEFHTEIQCDFVMVDGRALSPPLTGNIYENPNGVTNEDYCHSNCQPNPNCWGTYLSKTLTKCKNSLGNNPGDVESFAWGATRIFIKDCVEDDVQPIITLPAHQSFPNECRNSSETTTNELSTTIIPVTTHSPSTSTLPSSTTETTPTTSSTETIPTTLTTDTIPTTVATTSPTETTQSTPTNWETTPTTSPTTETTPAIVLTSEMMTTDSSKTETIPTTLTTDSIHTTIPTTESISTTPTTEATHSMPTTWETVPTTSPTTTTPTSTANTKIITSPMSVMPVDTTSNVASLPSPHTFSSTSQFTPTAANLVNNTKCNCNCKRQLSNLTVEEKKAIVTEILYKLTLNKSALSSTRRRFISVKDDRPSATAVGCSGIAMVSLALVILLAFDIETVIKFIMDLKNRSSVN